MLCQTGRHDKYSITKVLFSHCSAVGTWMFGAFIWNRRETLHDLQVLMMTSLIFSVTHHHHHHHPCLLCLLKVAARVQLFFQVELSTIGIPKNSHGSHSRAIAQIQNYAGVSCKMSQFVSVPSRLSASQAQGFQGTAVSYKPGKDVRSIFPLSLPHRGTVMKEHRDHQLTECLLK